MSRLLLALPLYTHVSSAFFINFLQLDQRNVVGTLAVMKVYLPTAMQQMVTDALTQDNWDRLVVIEADMMPPIDALTRIAAYPDSLDVVGSMYFQHPSPHRPVVYEQVDDSHYRAMQPEQITHMMDKPGLYPVDGVGFGFTSVHRRVFEKWDESVHMFHSTELGHDMHFCKHARAQGFSVHVDSGIHCGHLTEWSITYNDTKTNIKI